MDDLPPNDRLKTQSLADKGPAYVYVIGRKSEKGYRTYVGWSLDPLRRLSEHNSGKSIGAKSTRGGGWVLLYTEELPSRRAAMRREYHLKRDRHFRQKLSAADHDSPGQSDQSG